MNNIENWYDEKYDEWDRLQRHKIVFDIGGGPGRYSIYIGRKQEI